MSSKAQRLVKGSAFRVTEFFISAIVGLLMMPFIIHFIGDKMYGLWVLIGTFMGYYGLFDFGLMQAVQRFVSRAIGVNDDREMNKIINTILYLYMIIGVVILMVSAVLVFISPYIIKDAVNLRLFQTILPVLSLSLAIGFPMRVFKGVLIAHLRYDLNTTTEIVTHILRITLVFTLLKRYNGLFTLAMITFTTEMLMYAMTFIFAKKVDKNMVFSRNMIDRAKIKSIFKYSFVTAGANIALMMRFRVSSFIIAAFLGLKEVTIYSIALRLTEYFSQAMMSSMGILMPVFSQYEGKNDYNSIREKFLFTTKISCYIAILIGALILILGRDFIQVWMGEAYVSAYPLLAMLTVANIFCLMQTPTGGLLYGISKHKFTFFANTIEGFSNLILSLILVKKYGLLGIALGVTIPYSVMNLFIQPIYVCRVIGLKLYLYYFKTLLPAVIKSMVFFICFAFTLRSFIKPSYLMLFPAGLAGAVLFIIFSFFYGFNENERKDLLKGIKR
ncbi:MAG: oligosaccharide flippase family protein [Candidatus Omnitrophota bacterium]|jgi:O-antigen/teichoic acid export membrane protein